MNIRNEAQLSRYFDRRMSMSEEQNFLIALAGSEELRLAFRSQLELMKAIRDDKHDMRPIAEVRSRTIAALGLSAAATAPFLEHALLQSSKPPVAEAALTPTAAEPSSFFTKLGGRLMLLGGGLVSGFVAASLFFSSGPAPIHTGSALQPMPVSVTSGHTVVSQSETTKTALASEPAASLAQATPKHHHKILRSEAPPLTSPDQKVSQPVSKDNPASGAILTNGGISIKTTSNRVNPQDSK